MATGMVSSQSSQTSENKIIRTGESVSTSKSALADKNAKVFRHMVPGARFIMPDGLELQFLGGIFATSDPEQIAQLQAVADKPASMIYTHKEVAASIVAGQKVAADDAAGAEQKPE